MVLFICYLSIKEKAWKRPNEWTDKKSKFPHQNLKVQGQLLHFWLISVVELTHSSKKTNTMKKQFSIFLLVFLISANINAEISGVNIGNLTQLYNNQISKVLVLM